LGAKDLLRYDSEPGAEKSELKSCMVNDEFAGFEDFTLFGRERRFAEVAERNTAIGVRSAQEPDFAFLGV
jgi:hypothetical protein